jgi:hypothetical protein
MATDYTLQTRLRFDLSGNVGIGTTKPQSKLDVRGSVSATSLSGTLNWTDVSGAPPYELPPGSILVYDASMNIDSSFILADGSTVNRADYPELADVLGIPFDQPTFQLPNPALENQVDWDVSNNNIQTFIKNKPSIYKDTSNNVVSGSHLIPSTNVTYDLGSSTKRWKDLYLSGNTIDISGTRLSRHTDGSLMVHDVNGNYMTGRFSSVTTTANLGVGTDNPIYKLHVIGDTRIQGDLMVNGTQTLVNTDIQVTDQVVITNNGTGPALVVTQSGVETIADFCDETSGNIVMRIANGGNVGIGTSNPQAKLDVYHNTPIGQTYANGNYSGLKVSSSGGGGVIFGYDINHSIFLRVGRDGVGNTTTYYQPETHRFYTGGYIENQVERMAINDNGVYVRNNLYLTAPILYDSVPSIRNCVGYHVYNDGTSYSAANNTWVDTSSYTTYTRKHPTSTIEINFMAALSFAIGSTGTTSYGSMYARLRIVYPNSGVEYSTSVKAWQRIDNSFFEINHIRHGKHTLQNLNLLSQNASATIYIQVYKEPNTGSFGTGGLNIWGDSSRIEVFEYI